MLTDSDLFELAPKMGVPLEWVGFKDTLPKKLKTNRGYIINLDNQKDLDGFDNVGTHFTYLQISEYPNGKLEPIYVDSFGIAPPEIVAQRVEKNFGITYVPYNKKDIQSLASHMCGYYCLAFSHFVNHNPLRSGSLYTDTETFLDLFKDLNETNDYKYNEYILKHFFQPKDVTKQKPVEVF